MQLTARMLALVALFLFAGTAFAFSVTAPDSVLIAGDKNSFYVSVYNNTQETQSLKANFYSTAKYQISAPKSIAPNATTQIKITVFNNNANTYNEVDAKLEVYVGKNLEERTVTLRMVPQNGGALSSAVSGLFSFGSFVNETTHFSTVEWIVFWILIIVAAVLLVGFIARIVRRV